MLFFELALFLGLLIVLFLLGFPVPHAIGITAIVVLIFDRGIMEIPFELIAQRLTQGVNNFVLLAIPFFILTGKLMNTGGITKKIFQFANVLVGYLPGGLGHANVVASIIFAGMSGSAVADAAGLGTIEVKAMTDEGYDRDFSAALTAASSTIGPIIPPSINLVIFGIIGNVSITALLLAGLLPGLVMAACLMVAVSYYAIKRNYPRRSFPKVKEIWESLKASFLALLTPVILLGGILLGIFTPTEAAAVAALYAFVLSVFIYRELKWKDVLDVVFETAKETSLILFIIAVSSLYGWLLVRTRIPMILMEQVFLVSQNPLVILFMLVFFLLIVGMFMETNAAIIILTPIIMPLALAVGINPIHLGIIMVLNLMIGLLTPPIGMCLYAVARVSEISIDRMVRAIVPFYLPLIIALVLVTLFPQIALFLPNLLLR